MRRTRDDNEHETTLHPALAAEVRAVRFGTGHRDCADCAPHWAELEHFPDPPVKPPLQRFNPFVEFEADTTDTVNTGDLPFIRGERYTSVHLIHTMPRD